MSMGSDTSDRYPEQSCDFSSWGCRRLPFSLFPHLESAPPVPAHQLHCLRHLGKWGLLVRGGESSGKRKKKEKRGKKKKKIKKQELRPSRSHTRLRLSGSQRALPASAGGRMNQPRTAGRLRDRTAPGARARTDRQTAGLAAGTDSPSGNPGGASWGIPAAAAAPEPSPSRRHGLGAAELGMTEPAAIAIEPPARRHKSGLLLFGEHRSTNF